MNTKYLVVGTALAGFALQTVNAQASCSALEKTTAQTTSTSAQTETKIVKLDIEGMTCGSCAASVKTALGNSLASGTCESALREREARLNSMRRKSTRRESLRS